LAIFNPEKHWEDVAKPSFSKKLNKSEKNFLKSDG